MAQTTFTTDPGPGQAGQIASSADYQLNSAFAEGAIAPGLFVVRGTDPETQAEIPSATFDADAALGFAWLDPSDLSPASYEDGLPMTYLEKGEVFAVCEEAVDAGDPVFVRFAAGTGTVLGSVRNDADTASAVLLENAVFASTTAAAGIAVVKFHR